MDMRKAEIVEEKVVNVILVDPDNTPDWCSGWPEAIGDVSIGWTYTNGQFAPPPPVVLTKEQQEAKRQAAYTAEADPLFFKWQAGEATEAEWKAKRQEIRERFPYPVSSDAGI